MSTSKITDASIHIESSDQLNEPVVDSAVVLVDYHADRCGPCKMLEPIAREVVEETDAVVAKVDIDELQKPVHEQGIRSASTLQLYAGGEQVKEVIGVQNKENLVDIIEAAA